jgi:hypothetical protein
VDQLLREVDELLELDVDFSGNLFAEVSSHLVYFREHPLDAFFIDSKGVTTVGADCRISLQPSDKLLEFVLALRTLKREFSVRVAV